jgi:hypothetical protein
MYIFDNFGNLTHAMMTCSADLKARSEHVRLSDCQIKLPQYFRYERSADSITPAKDYWIIPTLGGAPLARAEPHTEHDAIPNVAAK